MEYNKKNQNELFDEIDDEEEIKEEIIIDNEEEENMKPKKLNVLSTYDKFLIDSLALDGNEKPNEYHYLLKNQMKNIIDDIKQKQNEELESKNNIKKQIFKDIKGIFDPSNKDDDTNNIIINKNNINQYTLNPNKIMNKQIDVQNSPYMDNLQDIEDTKIEDINEGKQVQNGKEENNDIISGLKNRGYLNNKDVMESKEYNINIDEFLKENTVNDEDIVNNITNMDNANNIKNNNNNNQIYGNKIYDNKSIKYEIKGSPELNRKINENYDYFSQNNKKEISINQQLTAKFNALASRENHYKNNNNEENDNNNKKSEMIYIDDCKNEEERKLKQKKFEEMKQKKLKELENKITQKRANSKPKPHISNPISNNVNNTNNNINSLRQDGQKTTSNKPIILRPKASKNKQRIYQNNQKKQNDNKSSNMTRPMTTKSNNISHISNKNNTILFSNNTSHFSTISRVPIKIERQESKIANKKVKNVHYSKMSNKKIIKKAINEVCLAGNSNKEYRDKINEIIDQCEFENYIILFRGNYGRFDIKAIYIGNAPNFIEPSMVATYYKYNISANQFKELRGTKEFSCIVDGVCLRK